MEIRARELTPDDVEECLDLVCCRPHYREIFSDPGRRRREIEAWRSLLGRSAIRSGLSEAPSNPPGRRILTFGASGFVRERWLREYLADPFPFAGPWITERYSRGLDDILLTDEEVRRANSGDGLHGIVLLMGWDPGRIPEEDLFLIKQFVVQSFLQAHVGFRIRQFVLEVLTGVELDFHTANETWLIRGRYETYYSRLGQPPPEDPPVLLGIAREEAQNPGREISVLAPLFAWRDVRFCFVPEQQRLLALAARHTSDKDLAGALKVSIHGLGRRFDRIYRRVAALQNPQNPVFPPNAGSGAKRRLLLDYLRENPQELRPHAFRAPRRPRSATRRPTQS